MKEKQPPQAQERDAPRLDSGATSRARSARLTPRFDPTFKSHAERQAQAKRRLLDPETGMFLHADGVGTTDCETWAWFGTPIQAARLARRAHRQGHQWPYRLNRASQRPE